MRQTLVLLSVFGFLSCSGTVQSDSGVSPRNVMLNPDQIYDLTRQWVDSVYNTMLPEERIAQLFWLAIETRDRKNTYQKYLQLIEEYKPGGIILFGMPVASAVEVIQEMQQLSKIPLLVSVDGENGLAMRFPGVVAFPNAMSLGAIQDNELIYQLGLEIARQCKVIGIHVNLAPVADVNVNPANPIIGSRSFGENPLNVAHKATAFMKGLQEGGVLAVAKHFPGHGDTDKDSHKTLPQVAHNRQRLNSVELLPFRIMIDSGLWGMMSAHLEVPALEKKKGVPASFSKSILVDELRSSMDFKGLIITDAVNMQGARIMGRPGLVDAMALAAGNDIVEFTENLPEGINHVINAIDNGLLSWKDVEIKCKRSLAFKRFLHMQQSENLSTDSLLTVLNTYEARRLNALLYQSSVTILNNKEKVFPFKESDDEKTACIVVGDAPVFVSGFKERFGIPVYELSASNSNAFDKTLASIGKFDRYVLIIADTRWGRLRENNARQERLMQLALKNVSTVLFMGNAYHLKSWNRLKDASGLAVIYQNTNEAQQAMFDFLIGEVKATGKLPVSVGGMYLVGDGYNLGD